MREMREAFKEMGWAPEVVAAAPGRVNLIGEHTDYNEGFVFPIALEACTRTAVQKRSDGVLRMRSLQAKGMLEVTMRSLRPGSVFGWGSYAAGAAWALQEHLGETLPGVNLLISSEVPQGAGLSSSAALECSVIKALAALVGAELAPKEMALLAQRAENEYVGVPCGMMDQMISMLGEKGRALLLDTRDQTWEQIPFQLEGEGLELLVVNTKASHSLADGEYAKRRRECEEAAEQLGVASLREVEDQAALTGLPPLLRDRAGHVVTENARVQEAAQRLREGRTREIGELLLASHASLRNQYQVSCEELDVSVEAAMLGGALGARMTGGGFGGSIIALVEKESVEAVEAEVKKAFHRRNWERPDILSARAGEGARLEEL